MIGQNEEANKDLKQSLKITEETLISP